MQSNSFLCRLNQRADTLGAKGFLHLTAVLDDRYLLQVGTEGTVGLMMREGDAMTECSGLTTVSACCHLLTSFRTR